MAKQYRITDDDLADLLPLAKCLREGTKPAPEMADEINFCWDDLEQRIALVVKEMQSNRRAQTNLEKITPEKLPPHN